MSKNRSFFWKKFSRFKTRENFNEAVRLGASLSCEGDTLLLSPMCASFDQFGSFEERGEVFKSIFAALESSGPG